MMHLDLQKSLRELIVLIAVLYIFTNFALCLFREPNLFTEHFKHFELHQREINVVEYTFITKAF